MYRHWQAQLGQHGINCQAAWQKRCNLMTLISSQTAVLLAFTQVKSVGRGCLLASMNLCSAEQLATLRCITARQAHSIHRFTATADTVAFQGTTQHPQVLIPPSSRYCVTAGQVCTCFRAGMHRQPLMHPPVVCCRQGMQRVMLASVTSQPACLLTQGNSKTRVQKKNACCRPSSAACWLGRRQASSPAHSHCPA